MAVIEACTTRTTALVASKATFKRPCTPVSDCHLLLDGVSYLKLKLLITIIMLICFSFEFYLLFARKLDITQRSEAVLFSFLIAGTLERCGAVGFIPTPTFFSGCLLCAASRSCAVQYERLDYFLLSPSLTLRMYENQLSASAQTAMLPLPAALPPPSAGTCVLLAWWCCWGIWWWWWWRLCLR